MDKSIIRDSAQVGVPPPADAPQEVSQQLQPEAGGIVAADGSYESPSARATRNERALEPLRYLQQPKPGGVAESITAVQQEKVDPFFAKLAADKDKLPAAPSKIIRRRAVPRPPVEAPTPDDMKYPPMNTIIGVEESVGPPRLTDEDRQRMPAASDSDSPSRGIPHPSSDPGKAITGGFGVGDQQYFALNGVELRVLVGCLFDELSARLLNDLRFNEAICYPQVSARVVVEIEGFAHDNDFIVDKYLPATADIVSKTPIAIARTIADEIAFVVVAERQETDASGQPVQPPDAIRDEIKVDRPRKRAVPSPTGMHFVDV